MKLVISLVVLSCALLEIRGYPYPVFTSSGNVASWSQGDANHGGRVLSRYYHPYNRRVVRGGPSTYSVWQPDTQLSPLTAHQALQHQQADRRRQALLEVNDTPPQENEVYYPLPPENPAVGPVEAIEAVAPVDVTPELIPTTAKAIVPVEPEIEEPVQQTKTVNKKKEVKTPVADEEDDDDDDEDYPTRRKLPASGYFPMFFGWGGNGPVAVANAFSTGKGGAAASDATAYGTLVPVRRSQ